VSTAAHATPHARTSCITLKAMHAEVEEVVPDKEAGVVVCCQMGGTLEPARADTNLGIQSRSMIAAYQLIKAGYKGVRVLKNGMNAWIEDGHDVYLYDE
jgi:hypothetical protein